MCEPVSAPVRRLRGQTLSHVWSPKCGRTLILTSASQVRLWVMLEANPQVSRICERPIRLASPEPHSSEQHADFWTVRSGVATWLLIGDDKCDPIDSPEQDATESRELLPPDVLRVSQDEIDSHQVWIRNWLTLLPYLCTASALTLHSLRGEVLQFCRDGATLEDAELTLAKRDPVLVRTAAIAELHAGGLFCEELTKRPWDRSIFLSRTAK